MVAKQRAFCSSWRQEGIVSLRTVTNGLKSSHQFGYQRLDLRYRLLRARLIREYDTPRLVRCDAGTL